jgi:hypothetical protein
MQTKIALIVGNGLTIDLAKRNNLWNPSEPILFPFNMPGGLPWRKALPHFNESLAEFENNSFELFSNMNKKRDVRLDSEIRHFLTLAYSNFDANVSEEMLLHWPWRKWIRRHHRNISTVISFNYETILERAFEISTGNRMYNICAGNSKHKKGPFLFKPHGSIDLEMAPGFIAGQEPRYPLNIFCSLNNTPVHQCERDRILSARMEGFAVLPAETSPYTKFQWVKPLYENWGRLASPITHFIIAGISYWDCDRAEIDYLIDGLPTSSEVIIANPLPPLELTKNLERKGRKVSYWMSGPERI